MTAEVWARALAYTGLVGFMFTLALFVNTGQLVALAAGVAPAACSIASLVIQLRADR